MELFQEIAAAIVLISTVVVAIEKICDGIGRPILWSKQKKQESDSLKKSLDNLSKDVKEVITLNEKQNTQISLLTESNKILMRTQLDELYEKNKHTRTLHEREYENLKEISSAYFALNGNGHYKKLSERMEKWTIIPDEPERNETTLQ